MRNSLIKTNIETSICQEESKENFGTEVPHFSAFSLLLHQNPGPQVQGFAPTIGPPRMGAPTVDETFEETVRFMNYAKI